MKLKYVVAAGGLIFFLAGALLFWAGSRSNIDDQNSRLPASAPINFESFTACQKQDYVWDQIKKSQHKSLPAFEGFGLVELTRLAFQRIETKGALQSDFSPHGWKKYLHAVGSTATIRVVPRSSIYSGVFEGAECGVIRLSLTYAPSGSRPVAPGLALKVFRDRTPSANVSALVSLYGQGDDYNFFKNPMSNIVPIGDEIGQRRVHNIFKKVSSYPEELVIGDFGRIGADGQQRLKPKSPRQIFFVPNSQLSTPSSESDFRISLGRIPAGTLLYKVYALPEKFNSFDYRNYTEELVQQFLAQSDHIADLETTSEFISSKFGDSGIFFQHELRPKK